MSNAINAIFNQSELEHFCKRYNVQNIDDLKVNTDGYHKHIVFFKDYVFLFPRNPKYEASLKKELSIYKEFTNSMPIALPHLIESVKDENISYYNYGVVSKLSGVAFSSVIDNLSYDQLIQFWNNLIDIMVKWHRINSSKFILVP
ncbi:MAG: hypothetical protein WCJ19_02685 [bacterium]